MIIALWILAGCAALTVLFLAIVGFLILFCDAADWFRPW